VLASIPASETSPADPAGNGTFGCDAWSKKSEPNRQLLAATFIVTLLHAFLCSVIGER
jgi:hypothetical protein